MDNETWVIEVGDAVLRKMATAGMVSLTPWESIVYCLWVADYSMRNAGDLETAGDLDAEFQITAIRAAEKLALPVTLASFSMAKNDFAHSYFTLFDTICAELRDAKSDNSTL